jgi:myosin V
MDMEGGHVQSRILQMNVILEALGNARTVRNDNSSRFGKLIQLLFSQQGMLEGACVETYLLELTRVVQQQSTERNFHIFYMILTETNATRLKHFKLEKAYNYQFLLQTASNGCFSRRDGVQDSELYAGFTKALQIVFTEKGMVDGLLGAIVAVLTVGNFHCLTTTSAEGDTIIERTSKNMQCLQLVADLLAVPPATLLNAMATRSVKAGGETFVVTLDSEHIATMRNMFAKSLYHSIFQWMIGFLNNTLCPDSSNADQQTLSSIGLLDMFGFEDLAHNSLEQLLINYTNENLQQQFDFMMIGSEQALYVREGIEWDFIEFPSAQECLDLVYCRGRRSLVSVLDEACHAPGGSDATFLSQVYQHFGNHDRVSATHLDRGKSMFGIRHYAGLVKYESNNFVSKNKVVSFPLESVLKESTSDFVKGLLEYTNSGDSAASESSSGNRTNKYKKKKNMQQQQGNGATSNQTNKIVVDSVSECFCQDVNELLDQITMTTSNYIKCFKPNNGQKKQNFVHNYVRDQMKYSGILHSLKVMRVGFPVRFTYLEFWKKYFPLILSLCHRKDYPSPEARKSVIDGLRRGDLDSYWCSC